MKKAALVAIAITAVTVAGLAQGTVNFNNRIVGSVDARVQTAVDGVFARGAGYTAQLYAGPAGSAEGDLVAVPGTATFRDTSDAAAGYINPVGETAVPGIAGGNVAVIQMRVWANNGGALTSYEAAEGVSEWGKSNLIDVSLGNPAGVPPTPAADLVGLTTFQLMVPEPSTYALLALGAAALFFRRRK